MTSKIWPVRPKCSHRCVALKGSPLKPVQILQHATRKSGWLLSSTVRAHSRSRSSHHAWMRRSSIQRIQTHHMHACSAIHQRKFLWVRRGCQASQRKGWPPGKFGKLPGKFGKLPGNLWIAVKLHSGRTSGEVTEKLPGKFGELPGKSGDFPEALWSLTPSQRLAKFVSKH